MKNFPKFQIKKCHETIETIVASVEHCKLPWVCGLVEKSFSGRTVRSNFPKNGSKVELSNHTNSVQVPKFNFLCFFDRGSSLFCKLELLNLLAVGFSTYNKNLQSIDGLLIVLLKFRKFFGIAPKTLDIYLKFFGCSIKIFACMLTSFSKVFKKFRNFFDLFVHLHLSWYSLLLTGVFCLNKKSKFPGGEPFYSPRGSWRKQHKTRNFSSVLLRASVWGACIFHTFRDGFPEES